MRREYPNSSSSINSLNRYFFIVYPTAFSRELKSIESKFVYYLPIQPPSTARISPLIQFEASDARKSTGPLADRIGVRFLSG